MREKSEYESLYDFIKKLFNTSQIKKLKLRYFDPTQSYEKNRIDKGLIEGLMIKRAKCTIYSVQESDTLGKDSELAATLAQGKPVIAYIPSIIQEKHAEFVKKQSISFLRDKIYLLLKQFGDVKTKTECLNWAKSNGFKIKITYESFEKYLFNILNDILNQRLKISWETIETEWATDKILKKSLDIKHEIVCNFIAIADKHFYNKRADTIKDHHPLGIQIDLSTGVANGVLVVRTIEDCSKLLYNILTNRLEFKQESEDEQKYYCLEEKISGSIYRIVTKDLKITNSFWNYYLLKEDN